MKSSWTVAGDIAYHDEPGASIHAATHGKKCMISLGLLPGGWGCGITVERILQWLMRSVALSRSEMTIAVKPGQATRRGEHDGEVHTHSYCP